MAQVTSADLAEALLLDVSRDIDKFDQMEIQHQREAHAKRLINGDLARAKSCINDAASRGEDVRLLNAFMLFYEGRIYLAVALSPKIESTFTNIVKIYWVLCKYSDAYTLRWVNLALASFQESVRLDPENQRTYFYIGTAYWTIDNFAMARQAFGTAQEGDDHEISLAAAKSSARLDEKKRQCFVATACYGDIDHPDVVALRWWRDNVLLSSLPGRLFVAVYYRLSPPLARCLLRAPKLIRIVRGKVLHPLVQRIGK